MTKCDGIALRIFARPGGYSIDVVVNIIGLVVVVVPDETHQILMCLNFKYTHSLCL